MLAALTPLIASGLTGLGKTVLVLVALTFILWSLYTSMVIPKKRPGFPRRLDVYITVTVLLFAAQMTSVVWVAETQEVETHEATSGETGNGGETTGGTETTGGSAGGDADAGAAVFASAGCVGCHTLADAGASGNVGPNLDELQPTEQQVVAIVTAGRGAMPSFSGQLDEQQIADVAAYVSAVAGT